jgi:hypothetical protein
MIKSKNTLQNQRPERPQGKDRGKYKAAPMVNLNGELPLFSQSQVCRYNHLGQREKHKNSTTQRKIMQPAHTVTTHSFHLL